MSQILYFLFYSSSRTVGNLPRHFTIRVHHHGPSRGFNETTRSLGPPWVLRQNPMRLRSNITYGPSHGRPNRRMDHLRVIHLTNQPNPQISPLYGTLSPTGSSHPTSCVTSNGTGHTLRVESTHELGHPTEWVAPWVRSVPMESLDTPSLTL